MVATGGGLEVGLTEEADALAEHDAALELAKDGGASDRLDDFSGDNVDDEAGPVFVSPPMIRARRA